MGKANSRTEVEKSALDLEHELPASSGEGDETASGTAGTGEPSAPESELQKLKAERDSLLDRLSRAQAEFENARRRASKEQQDFRDYASSDAIKSLLPVVDSLERALQVRSEPAEFRSGVELIYKQLQAVLARLSVNPIPAKGESFDPHFHEAVEIDRK